MFAPQEDTEMSQGFILNHKRQRPMSRSTLVTIVSFESGDAHYLDFPVNSAAIAQDAIDRGEKIVRVQIQHKEI